MRFLLPAVSLSLLVCAAPVWAQSRGTLSSRSVTGGTYRALPALGRSAKTTSSQKQPVKFETELVMGRVGVVRVASVTLRRGRNPGDKALAVATRETNLVVLMEKDGYQGCLMQDNTLGWVASEAVELLDYRVQVKLHKAVAAEIPQVAPPTPETEPTETAPESETTGDPRADAVIREAFTYIGVRYVWAGNTRNGLDCSAFVKNVFAKTLGVGLPRHSGDQARVGTPVTSTDDLSAGDRLYFDMGRKGRVSHTGIYLGNGYFIHASSNRHCVGVDKLSSGNYWKSLVAARRDL
ncbi:MAG: C40 family peptidase [Armatimonadetes bacterium]|nr:C40 family peptidase [Armatimonadota bacterium]